MSTNFKTLLLISAGLVFLSFGCAAAPSGRAASSSRPTPELRSVVPDPEPKDGIQEPTPRTIASLRLAEQARLLLESNKPDEAIRILEKALNIDSNNGRNYYFLAEAWIMKGSRIQAFEFNRIAGIYLNGELEWMLKVQRQKERIKKMSRAR